MKVSYSFNFPYPDPIHPKEVRILPDASQYEGDMEYLQTQANNGILTYDNAIWKKLDGKRNVKEVDAFLKSIASKIK